MDTLDRIYEMMFCELDDIAKKEKLDSKDVELIDKFVDIIKDIDEIGMSSDMEYSQSDGNYMRGRSGRTMPMYRRSYSYMGGNGYSRGSNRDEILNHLSEIANMATDEKDRKAVERLMEQMENR